MSREFPEPPRPPLSGRRRGEGRKKAGQQRRLVRSTFRNPPLIHRPLESVHLNSPQCHDPLIDYPQVVPTHDLHPGEILLDLTRVYDSY